MRGGAVLPVAGPIAAPFPVCREPLELPPTNKRDCLTVPPRFSASLLSRVHCAHMSFTNVLVELFVLVSTVALSRVFVIRLKLLLSGYDGIVTLYTTTSR